ncbi:glycoside hydrolase family 36 protein [Pseudaeromonas paramecii]
MSSQPMPKGPTPWLQAFRQGLLIQAQALPGFALPMWQADEVVVRWDGPALQQAAGRQSLTSSQEGHEATEWILYDGHPFKEPVFEIYGEGYQMLAQTAGTWDAPKPVGRCPDASYGLGAEKGYHSCYNLLLVRQANGWTLMGFTACREFVGVFRLYPGGRLQILMDTDGRQPANGETWQSEPLFITQGPTREAVLEQLAQRICAQHPPLTSAGRPTGWCSWYHYYADVSRADIEENLSQLQAHWPGLEFVQIDDGFQAAMGDWLRPSDKFAGGLAPLVAQIRAQGAEPALWLAPFIAEPNSQLFQSHPEWFIHDRQGRPIPAEQVTYGGWRCTPWYCLDGSHPEVQAHLRGLFATLRRDYGIRYFKLDALYWGLLPAGDRHDGGSRVAAYRAGLAAMLAGAGADAFLLGCNAPLWPSLGLVHGMRVADDVERSGPRFRQLAREIFYRSWQADRLWRLDPDCLCLLDIPGQQACPAEYDFHLATLVAAGGSLLLGDRLQALGSAWQAKVARLQALTEAGVPPLRFTDTSFDQGWVRFEDHWLGCLFNWQGEPKPVTLPLGSQDFWEQRPLAVEQILAPYGALVIQVPVAPHRALGLPEGGQVATQTGNSAAVSIPLS